MIRYILTALAGSLLLTLAAELAAARLWRLKGKDLIPVILANLLTNPLYVLSILYLQVRVSPSRLSFIRAVMEILIFAAEGVIYRRFLRRCRHPWLLSLTANLASIAAGILLTHIRLF